MRTLKKIHFKKYRQKVTIDARVHFYKKWLKIKNFGVAKNIANYLPEIEWKSFFDSFCVFEVKNRKSFFVKLRFLPTLNEA
jgi:hypothetical protein